MSAIVVIGSAVARCAEFLTLRKGSFLLLAQTEGGATEGVSTGPGLIDMLPMFALMWIVVWFVMIRPQRKKAREHAHMLSSLNKHDQVRTIGGIIGKVVQVDADQDMVILVIDDSKNVKMRVSRQSVAAVLPGDEIPAKITEEDTAR